VQGFWKGGKKDPNPDLKDKKVKPRKNLLLGPGEPNNQRFFFTKKTKTTKGCTLTTRTKGRLRGLQKNTKKSKGNWQNKEKEAQSISEEL